MRHDKDTNQANNESEAQKRIFGNHKHVLIDKRQNYPDVDKKCLLLLRHGGRPHSRLLRISGLRGLGAIIIIIIAAAFPLLCDTGVRHRRRGRGAGRGRGASRGAGRGVAGRGGGRGGGGGGFRCCCHLFISEYFA